MESIENYKGLSNKLYVWGFNPPDLVVILVLFLFVHGFINSLLVDLVYVILSLVIAKKVRTRPEGILITLYLYFTTPTVLPVPYIPEIRAGSTKLVTDKTGV